MILHKEGCVMLRQGGEGRGGGGGGGGRTGGLAERTAQLYYTHGVFISAHPTTVIAAAIAIVLLSCIPLVNIPLPSNVPQMYMENGNQSQAEVPRWYAASQPNFYIQQVILKSTVSPWTGEMLLTDAIRAPLAEAFRLVETVQNYQHPNTRTTLGDLCVHVESPSRPSPLPQFNCLLVSPANLWYQDHQRFFMDNHIVSTVYNYQNIQVGKVNLAELLFGVSLKEAGMKRYPLRNRQRVIQFAVTILLTKYDKQYIDGLRSHLKSIYPLLQENTTSEQSGSLLHVFYPGDFDFHEFVPLFFTYLMLFFYMYFSVRKIELVRSKVGVALSALFTVISSLVMSIGLCLFFGLDPAATSRGREIFPYLVVVVGLENIIVLTKSVVSTQPHLDSKIRVAQGLSKEGWSITKNLLTEVTILTAGLLTLVPAIQEFCILAMVGLLCDLFLQVNFFATVLSLDIRGADSTGVSQLRGGGGGGLSGLSSHPRTIPRSRSVPRLHYPQAGGPQDSIIHPHTNNRIPKRLKLVEFWARTRIVQRAFMLFMVIWIGRILYNSGIIKHFVSLPEGDFGGNLDSAGPILGVRTSTSREGAAFFGQHDTNINFTKQKVKQGEVLSKWPGARPIAPVKWCYLVTVYNSSVGPCRLSVLEPLRLSQVISPSRAASLRNPSDVQEKTFKWNSLAQALDPSDYVGDFERETEWWERGGWETPYLPTSPLEVLLVTVLCVVSMIVIAYTALALYHCVCSRNYAQWRSTWNYEAQSDTTQVVLQAMPLILEGHTQCVEWLATDGYTVASSCLGGEVVVWDACSGERLAHIDRKQYFAGDKAKRFSKEDDQVFSDYESGSPPSVKEMYLRNGRRRPLSDEVDLIRDTVKASQAFPDLTSAINTNFSSRSVRSGRQATISPVSGFDYGPIIKQLYVEMEELNLMEGIEDCRGGLCEEEDGHGSLESLEQQGGGADPSGAGLCQPPQIWSMDLEDNLISIGTSTGTLEFWEATTGKFKCIFDDNCGVGVTCIKLVGDKIVVARLNGSLEVFTIEWGSQYGHATYRRMGHMRAASAGHIEELNYKSGCELRCRKVSCVRAHQQPITTMQVEAGRIVTGSHDHTLKVFSLCDQLMVFTLHGHCGPITSLFIDTDNPLTAGSGSHDGMVCVWDLLTGACVYSLEAHDGPVISLTYSVSYVISLGGDERLCVWDRFQGHLLSTIQAPQTYCTTMTMLTHNLLISSKQGSLVIWDVRNGEPVRIVKLGHCDECVFVRTILPLRDSVACDYGNQVRIVRFPLVRDKMD